MIIVASIIENALLKIIAVGENGDFVFVVAEIVATALLIDGMQNVEELADAAHFVGFGEGIKFGKSGFDETGFGR